MFKRLLKTLELYFLDILAILFVIKLFPSIRTSAALAFTHNCKNVRKNTNVLSVRSLKEQVSLLRQLLRLLAAQFLVIFQTIPQKRIQTYLWNTHSPTFVRYWHAIKRDNVPKFYPKKCEIRARPPFPFSRVAIKENFDKSVQKTFFTPSRAFWPVGHQPRIVRVLRHLPKCPCEPFQFSSPLTKAKL